MLDLLLDHSTALLIGALGYNIRKYTGDQLNRWILKPIFRWLNRMFLKPAYILFRRKYLKTERDIALFTHYILRAKKRGHDSKNPYICKDGACSILA